MNTYFTVTRKQADEPSNNTVESLDATGLTEKWPALAPLCLADDFVSLTYVFDLVEVTIEPDDTIYLDPVVTPGDSQTAERRAKRDCICEWPYAKYTNDRTVTGHAPYCPVEKRARADKDFAAAFDAYTDGQNELALSASAEGLSVPEFIETHLPAIDARQESYANAILGSKPVMSESDKTLYSILSGYSIEEVEALCAGKPVYRQINPNFKP